MAWDPDFVERYDSWTGYVKASQAESPMKESQRSSRKGSRRFTGTDTFDEAIELAYSGWSKGFEDLQTHLADLSTRLGETTGRTVEPHIVGGRPIAGRVAQGHPASMARLTENPQTTETVDIVVNFAASAGVDKEAVIRRGASVVVLVEKLQSAGFGVDLKVVDVTSGSGTTTSVEVDLLKPGQPIDRDLLNFALAHPATLRRLWMSLAETWPHWVRDDLGIGGGYGRPEDHERASEEADIYLPRMLSGSNDGPDWSDPEEVAQWVEDTLEAQGVVLQ